MNNRMYDTENYQSDGDVKFQRSTKEKIDRLRLVNGQKFSLHYDFGDDWMFVINVQRIAEAEEAEVRCHFAVIYFPTLHCVSNYSASCPVRTATVTERTHMEHIIKQLIRAHRRILLRQEKSEIIIPYLHEISHESGCSDITQGYSVDVGVIIERKHAEKVQREIDFIVNSGDQRIYIQSIRPLQSK